MKEIISKYRLQEMVIRLTAAILSTIPAYMIYLYIGSWFLAKGIEYIHLIAAAIACFIISSIQPQGVKEKTMTRLIVISAPIAAGVISFIALRGYGIASFFAAFLIIVWVWSRAVKYYFEEYNYIYTIEQFYKDTILIALLNFIAILDPSSSFLQASMNRYAIVYIVLAILILFEVRNNKYLKDIKRKKSALDILFTIFILAATFIMSTEKVVAVTFGFIKSTYLFVVSILIKLINIVLIPISYLITWLFNLFQPDIVNQETERRVIEYNINVPESAYEPYTRPESLNILSSVLFAIVSIIVICVIYTYIDRYIRKRHNDEYDEEKEFALDIRLAGASNLLNGLKDKVVRAYKKATFNLTADNKEKLRHEYKVFLGKIIEWKLLEDKGFTAENVQQILVSAYPEMNYRMRFITAMYEDVRYGMKMPQDIELKEFRAKTSEILKVLNYEYRKKLDME